MQSAAEKIKRYQSVLDAHRSDLDKIEQALYLAGAQDHQYDLRKWAEMCWHRQWVAKLSAEINRLLSN